MVAGTNALMWNMREFSTNPMVSQQLQLISEYLRGINRGEGIGFFLLITDDENRSIKITPQLVKRVVPLLFFGLVSFFFKNRDLCKYSFLRPFSLVRRKHLTMTMRVCRGYANLIVRMWPAHYAHKMSLSTPLGHCFSIASHMLITKQPHITTNRDASLI